MAKVSLPMGFRFHPTDEELIVGYLKKKVMRKRLPSDAVSEIKLYEYAPWEFREMTRSKDLEWYFFCVPRRKYKTGSKMCRDAKGGHWKATGEEKLISYHSQVVGNRRSLVFYEGKPPSRKCNRTNWVMHEYRLGDMKRADASIFEDGFVVCKIFEKSDRGPKNGEQYGAPIEEEADDDFDEDVSDSLMPHPVAIPSSSLLVPGEGQDAAMISSTLDSGDGEDSTFPQYSEAPVVSAQHPSPRHDDVHSLLCKFSDVDASNGNDVQQDIFGVCKIFEKSARGPKNGEQYGAPFEEEADDDFHHVPGEGQDAAMISSTLDSGDRQGSTFPQYSEPPVASAQHTSPEYDDLDIILLNFLDEDVNTSNGNDVQQENSNVPNKTTVEDADAHEPEDISNHIKLNIDKFLEEENLWQICVEGSFFEKKDMEKDLFLNDNHSLARDGANTS